MCSTIKFSVYHTFQQHVEVFTFVVTNNEKCIASSAKAGTNQYLPKEIKFQFYPQMEFWSTNYKSEVMVLPT
jgi:hypothetical protein